MPQTSGCWANLLDDCNGKLTREHLISVAATPHDDRAASRAQKEQVLVRHSAHGGRRSWERNIKVNDLVSRMLCEGHNARSSELDAEGGNFSRAVWAICDLAKERHSMRLPWATKSFEVNGPLFERWLMKTAINIAVASRDDLRIGSATAGTNQPTAELAEMVYDRRTIIEPYGLWFVTRPDYQLSLEERYTDHHWGRGTDIANGMLFSFCGFRFILSLTNEDPPWNILGNMTGWRRYLSVRHLRDLRCTSIGASLLFRWPASLVTREVVRGRDHHS